MQKVHKNFICSKISSKKHQSQENHQSSFVLLLHNTVGKGLEEITWTFSLKNFQRALWDCLLKYSARPVQKNNICHECSTYLKIESWTIFQYHYQYSSIIIVVITKMTVITISSVLLFFFWHIHVTLLYTLQIFHITSLSMESSTKLYQQW